MCVGGHSCKSHYGTWHCIVANLAMEFTQLAEPFFSGSASERLSRSGSPVTPLSSSFQKSSSAAATVRQPPVTEQKASSETASQPVAISPTKRSKHGNASHQHKGGVMTVQVAIKRFRSLQLATIMLRAFLA